MFPIFFTALLAYIPFLVINAAVFYFLRPRRRVRAMTLVLLACIPLLFPIGSIVRSQWLADGKLTAAAVACVIFAFGWYGYMKVYFVTEWSLTVEYLVRLYRAPGQSLTITEMETLFPMTGVLEDRTTALLSSGVVVESADGRILTLSGRGRVYGGVAYFLRSRLNWGNEP